MRRELSLELSNSPASNSLAPITFELARAHGADTLSFSLLAYPIWRHSQNMHRLWKPARTWIHVMMQALQEFIDGPLNPEGLAPRVWLMHIAAWEQPTLNGELNLLHTAHTV